MVRMDSVGVVLSQTENMEVGSLRSVSSSGNEKRSPVLAEVARVSSFTML